jgi:hypothetical protein
MREKYVGFWVTLVRLRNVFQLPSTLMWDMAVSLTSVTAKILYPGMKRHVVGFKCTDVSDHATFITFPSDVTSISKTSADPSVYTVSHPGSTFSLTILSPPPGATATSWPGASHCRGSRSHSRRTSVGRTLLDEWPARRRDLYLTKHNTHNGHTSMAPVGFEPAIPASERPKTHALDRVANGIGHHPHLSPTKTRWTCYCLIVHHQNFSNKRHFFARWFNIMLLPPQRHFTILQK